MDTTPVHRKLRWHGCHRTPNRTSTPKMTSLGDRTRPPRHQHPFPPPTLHALLHLYLRRPACPHIKLAIRNAMPNRSLPTCPAAAVGRYTPNPRKTGAQTSMSRKILLHNPQPSPLSFDRLLRSQLAHRNTPLVYSPRGTSQ